MLGYIKYSYVLSKKLNNIYRKQDEQAENEIMSNGITSPPLVVAKFVIIKAQESQLCYCWHRLCTAEVMDGNNKWPGSWSRLLNSFTTSLRSIYGESAPAKLLLMMHKCFDVLINRREQL